MVSPAKAPLEAIAAIRVLVETFGDNSQNIHVDEVTQIVRGLEPIDMKDIAAVKQLCQVLLLWVLDGKKHGNGFGFPFDRPHAEFYRRLNLLWERLYNLQKKCITSKPLSNLIGRIKGDLLPLIDDTQCRLASLFYFVSFDAAVTIKS